MKNNKSISIVVPAYNAEKTIKRCLDSIVKQTISDYKVYVVNDGSTDHTANIINQYKKDKRFNIIHLPNSGVSIARNRALEDIDSEYVTFVDSDDYISKNYLNDLLKGFISKDIDVVAGARKYLDKNLITVAKLKYNYGIYNAEDSINILLDENGPQGYITGKMFKTKIIKNNNIYLDPTIHVGEDLIFCIQYLLNAKKMNVISSQQYNYIQFEDSLSHAATLYNRQTSFKEAYLNYLSMGEKLEKIVPYDSKYNSCHINIKARIARICEDFLRTMYLNKDMIELDEDLEKKIIGIMHTYKDDFYKSSLINKKQKVYFWFLDNYPIFIKISDKRRFK